MDYSKIYIAAKSFKEAIQKCDKKLLPITFKEFPKGSCGDAVLLLGKYLSDVGLGEFDYVLGGVNEKSHAWLQQNKLIVDITADQFDDQTEEIIKYLVL